MKTIRSVAVAGLLACVSACSKKEAEPVAQPAPEPAAPAQPQPAMAPVARAPSEPARLENVHTALQQQNYDAAVNALLQARPAEQNSTSAQNAQYMQQLQNTIDALRQAREKDPKAAAAYERLSRSILGR